MTWLWVVLAYLLGGTASVLLTLAWVRLRVIPRIVDDEVFDALAELGTNPKTAHLTARQLCDAHRALRAAHEGTWHA